MIYAIIIGLVLGFLFAELHLFLDKRGTKDE